MSNPDGATLDANYAYPIQYKCGTATDWTNAPVKAGADTVIPGIPTGTSCSVREGTIADTQTPTGYSWATSFTPDPATVTINNTVTPVEVTVNNTITRDKGSLKILKSVSNPDGATLDANYAYPIQYKCGTATDWTNAPVKAGADTVIPGIPTGTSCSVREGTIADTQTPTGYSWATSFTPDPATVTINNTVTPVEVTVNNTITRDKGSLKILKSVSNPDGATLDANYAYPIQYKCGTATDWTNAPVKAGADTVIPGIPTGTSCSVREGTIADTQTPTGYSWATSFTPDPATVTINNTVTPVEVTVNNTITRDKGSLKILKSVSNPDGATLDANYDYPIQYKCGTATDWTNAPREGRGGHGDPGDPDRDLLQRA